MSRNWFLFLQLIPILLIYPVMELDPPLEWKIGFVAGSIAFVWILQILRLRSVGLSWRETLTAFFFGTLSKNWWKAWQKDPN